MSLSVLYTGQDPPCVAHANGQHESTGDSLQSKMAEAQQRLAKLGAKPA